MTTEVWHLIVALFALLGPALVFGGIIVGRLQEKTSSAHKRLDKMEDVLAAGFHDMRQSMEKAWVNCPLAHDDHKKGS